MSDQEYDYTFMIYLELMICLFSWQMDIFISSSCMQHVFFLHQFILKTEIRARFTLRF